MAAMEADVVDKSEYSSDSFTDDDDDDAPPSTVTRRAYWAWAEPTVRTTSVNTGKWMIFEDAKRHDELWTVIRNAVRDGTLYCAKAGTEYGRRMNDKETFVLILYVPDSDDIPSVRRVLEFIRSLGVTRALYYKTDRATRDGRYGAGSWLYTSPSGNCIKDEFGTVVD